MADPQAQVSHAGPGVVDFAVDAAVGFAVNLAVAAPTLGAAFGATTGAALAWLLRQPSPTSARSLLAAA